MKESSTVRSHNVKFIYNDLQDQQRKSAIVAANGRDFRQAKQRLKSIIGANLAKVVALS